MRADALLSEALGEPMPQLMAEPLRETDRSLPRGLRVNNPLNIERNPYSVGLAAEQRDPRFATYETPDAGWADADRLLGVYGRKHGINTLQGVINRWAPAAEKANNPSSYAAAVSRETGIDPTATIDLSDPAVRAPILKAMARVEQGRPVEMPALVGGAGSDAIGGAPRRAGARMSAETLFDQAMVTIDALPRAPATPAEQAAEPNEGFLAQLKTSIVGGNATALGEALRGHATIAKSPKLAEMGKALAEWGEKYVVEGAGPRVSRLEDLSAPKDFSWDEITRALGDVYSYGKGVAAQGLGSMVPVVGGAAAGALAGLPGGPGGAAVGAAAGAGGTSYALNYGEAARDLRKELKDRLDKGEMSDTELYGWAAPVAAAMASLDVLGLARIGGMAAKRAIREGIIKAVAKGIGEGALVEGATEGLQETIKQGAMSALSGNPALTAERALDVANAAAAGALTGGIVGGPARGVGNLRAPAGAGEIPAPAEAISPTDIPVAPETIGAQDADVSSRGGATEPVAAVEVPEAAVAEEAPPTLAAGLEGALAGAAIGQSADMPAGSPIFAPQTTPATAQRPTGPETTDPIGRLWRDVEAVQTAADAFPMSTRVEVSTLLAAARDGLERASGDVLTPEDHAQITTDVREALLQAQRIMATAKPRAPAASDRPDSIRPTTAPPAATISPREQEKLFAEFRDRLDTMGLKGVSLAFVDKLERFVNGETKPQASDAVYFNRAIQVALDNPTGPDGMRQALNHETIHAFRSLGIFTDQEWKALQRIAHADPDRVAKVDRIYRDLGHDARVEEAIAMLFADYVQGRGQHPTFVRRMMERIAEFLEALRNFVTGHGNMSARARMRRLSDGTDRGAIEEAMARQAETETDAIVAKNAARAFPEASPGSSPLAYEGSIIGPPIAAARYAARDMSPAKILSEATSDLLTTRRLRLSETPDPGWLKRTALHPRMIAQLYHQFAPTYVAAVRMRERNDAYASELSTMVKPYNDLTSDQKANVNKVLELSRLQSNIYTDGVATNLLDAGDRRPTLTKRGETVRLTPEELAGYQAVRAAMDRALDMYRDSLLRSRGIASGTSIETVRQLATEDRSMESVIERMEEIENAKATGYVPFTRRGQWGISVKNKDGDLVDFRKLEPSGVPLAGRKLTDQRAGRIREELLRQYPASEGYRVGSWFETASEEAMKGQGVSLEQVDMLAQLGGADLAAYPGLRDALERGLQVGGFRKHFLQSSNVAGYSTDFERSIADYIIGMSGYLARQETRPEFDAALARLGAGTDPKTGQPKAVTRQPNLLKYAQEYIDYVQSPIEEFQSARALTFFFYLAGNISSALTNMMQVPMVSGPYLGQFAAAGTAAKQLGRAYRDALKMLDVRRGVVDPFDLDKAPADVREDLTRAVREGDLVAQSTYEMMATASGRNEWLRSQMKPIRRTGELIASTFTTAERLNRMVTYIAAHRMARQPGLMDRANKVLEGDALWRTVRQPGQVMSPDQFARYVVDETQFRQGKVNRPVAMRGFGAWMLQFKGFMLQSLELYWRLLSQHGKDGRVAFGFMTLGLLAATGMFGAPFGDDMRSLYEAAYRRITKRDIDVEKEIRTFIYDMTSSPRAAEIATRGLARSLGVDLTKRLGMGDNVPDTPKDMLGIPLEMTWGRASRAYDKASEGAYMGAAAELMPAFMRNPALAASWGAEGIRGQKSGRVTIPPEKITLADQLTKAVGFTPSSVARERERFEMERRVGEAAKDIQTAYYTKMARAIADQARARAAGDRDGVDRAVKRRLELQQEIARENASAAPEDRIMLSPSYLQNLVRVELMGRDAKSAPTKARPEVARIRQAMAF